MATKKKEEQKPLEPATEDPKPWWKEGQFLTIAGISLGIFVAVIGGIIGVIRELHFYYDKLTEISTAQASQKSTLDTLKETQGKFEAKLDGLPANGGKEIAQHKSDLQDVTVKLEKSASNIASLQGANQALTTATEKISKQLGTIGNLQDLIAEAKKASDAATTAAIKANSAAEESANATREVKELAGEARRIVGTLAGRNTATTTITLTRESRMDAGPDLLRFTKELGAFPGTVVRAEIVSTTLYLATERQRPIEAVYRVKVLSTDGPNVVSVEILGSKSTLDELKTFLQKGAISLDLRLEMQASG